MTILHGDCREQLATLPDNSVDAIVTDPPYELGFMGKKWDASGIAYDGEVWAQCLRVLKPGGHLCAFGGTRTYHRMTCAIEDAGFEIRDSLHWLYGSGFPKSLDVSKAIDKVAGAERKPIGPSYKVPNAKAVNPHFINAAGRRSDEPTEVDYSPTAPATPAAAAAAAGWGTALKPAHEPIVLARKPLAGTVAANVMEYGTGALNIDATRVGMSDTDRARIETATWIGRNRPDVKVYGDYATAGSDQPMSAHPSGRWPANLVLTHSPTCDLETDCAPPCPVAVLDEQSCDRPGGNYPTQRGAGVATGFGPGKPTEGGRRDMGDIGGASRYFATTTWDPELDVPFLYVAKPSRAERNAGLDGMTTGHTDFGGNGRPGAGFNEVVHGTAPAAAANFHPTVKPVALIRYLIRLITPPDGTVLDPFLGSGTTAVAAILEGFEWIGCELTEDYLPIIEARVAHAQTIPIQQDLFA